LRTRGKSLTTENTENTEFNFLLLYFSVSSVSSVVSRELNAKHKKETEKKE